jgi:tartrate-resistant acid phosphatase type 5
VSLEETAGATERHRLNTTANSSGRGSGGAAPAAPSSSLFARQDRFKQWKWVAGGSCGVLLLLIVLSALAAGGGGGARLPDTSHRIYARMLIVGDWGRQGLHNQSDVAAVMGEVAHTTRPDFVISTGDNFYDSGLSSVQDDLFRSSFVDVYSSPSLKGVPWHAVLGNHDYGESGLSAPEKCPAADPDCFYSPLHELDVGLRTRDPRWHCERTFELSLGEGKAEIFFIDTNPFIEAYRNMSWAGQVGGLNEQSWRGQLKEFEGRLAASKAQWKLVVGHHPVYSSGGAHGDTAELQQYIEPLLHKYNVQAYFSGHDHHLEHLRVPKQQHDVDYIISGAGSQVRPVRDDEKESEFAYYGSGFVQAVLKSELLELKFFGILSDNHEPIHTVVIPRVPHKGRRRLRGEL